jgi:hypothetical protein
MDEISEVFARLTLDANVVSDDVNLSKMSPNKTVDMAASPCHRTNSVQAVPEAEKGTKVSR